MNTNPNNESMETQADGTAAHPHTQEERHEKSKRHAVAILATSAYIWGLILLLLVVLLYVSCR
jgi:hypothetical protein